jgi:hypothetical protein
MRGGVGEEPVDEFGSRRPRLAVVRGLRDLLQHAARDQPAHAVRHQVDLRRARLRQDLLDEVIHPGRRALNVEPGRGHLPLDVVEQTTKERPLGRSGEGIRGRVVEAVDPDRSLSIAQPPVRDGVQVGVLPAPDEHLVPLVHHQPQHRAFELVELRVAVPVDTNVRSARVEPVERVVDRRVDPGGGSRVTADVDDRKLAHEPSSISCAGEQRPSRAVARPRPLRAGARAIATLP